MRLQKYLAECGEGSRRSCEELILAGKVSVDGSKVTKLGAVVDPDKAEVRVRGRIVKPEKRGVVLLYKPRGVVSTKNDPEGRRTVMDYLPKRYFSYFPVGRLDYDSSGLVIMTNDGDLAEYLMHPRYQSLRIYRVRAKSPLTAEILHSLSRGVKLKDGLAKGKARALSTAPAGHWLELEISEGRNHLVRRMMEAVGSPVERLVRVAHGPFKLGNLRPGAIRELSTAEYERARKRVTGVF